MHVVLILLLRVLGHSPGTAVEVFFPANSDGPPLILPNFPYIRATRVQFIAKLRSDSPVSWPLQVNCNFFPLFHESYCDISKQRISERKHTQEVLTRQASLGATMHELIDSRSAIKWPNGLKEFDRISLAV